MLVTRVVPPSSCSYDTVGGPSIWLSLATLQVMLEAGRERVVQLASTTPDDRVMEKSSGSGRTREQERREGRREEDQKRREKERERRREMRRIGERGGQRRERRRCVRRVNMYQ